MVRSLDEIIKDEESKFPPQSNRAVLLNKDERHFIYNQLMARKYQLEEELMMWAESKDKKEILKASNLINEIQKHMDKLLG
jgi:predicted oxidoreductase (fatty acid repression mutant protein)